MRRRRRPTLHHAVKDKRVTVLGPVKQPEMDFMSHRGGVLSWVGTLNHDPIQNTVLQLSRHVSVHLWLLVWPLCRNLFTTCSLKTLTTCPKIAGNFFQCRGTPFARIMFSYHWLWLWGILLN